MLSRLILSLDQIEDGLRSAFPALPDLSPLALLGEGFGSLVVETAGGLVFRVARLPEAGEGYAREAQALPRLKAYLPVAIPEPQCFLPSSSAFPYGVIGYRKLPGEPLDFAAAHGSAAGVLAEQLGRVLRALHHAPLDAALPAQSGQQLRDGWQQVRDESLPALREVLSTAEYQTVTRWWEEFLADETMLDYPAVVTHGDFWFGNILAENSDVVGLLDFQEVGVDDPARDFIPLLYSGEGWLRRVMAAYRRAGGRFDGGFEHRLWHLWALREFGGAAYAVRYDDCEELADSVEKIRKGPLLSSRGLDGWG